VRAQFIFTTNDGTITITEYIGPGGDVIIPDTTNDLPITSVAEDAFFKCESVTSVTIGTNVTSIGQNAFFQCTSLASVTIPASVTNIGAGPCIDCQSLTVISVSASNLHYISTNELLLNKNQTSLIQYPGGLSGSYTIPAAITNIGQALIGNTLTDISANPANLYFSSTNGVLFNKNQTTLIEYPGGAGGSYTVPHSVTNIASASFEYSTNLDTVSIGPEVTSIGGYAFYDSAILTAISVNATNAFYTSTNGVLFNKNQTMLIQYPSGLAGSCIIPDTVTNIGNGAFGDAFGLGAVVIPNSVISIGVEAFYGCESLTNAPLGNAVASIGTNAFYYCISLPGLTIPNSVTNIEEYAFFYCPSLTSVVFGSGVTAIGEEAFYACQGLTNVCFEGNAPTDGGNIFAEDYLSSVSYVEGTTGWGSTFDGIPTAPCAECAVVAPAQPGIISASVLSGTNLVLNATNGVFGGTYYVLMSTNLTLPFSQWTSVATNVLSASGNFTIIATNTVTPKISQRFFILEEQ
jgi:BspA type Leucine rich repeat region (6 copies)